MRRQSPSGTAHEDNFCTVANAEVLLDGNKSGSCQSQVEFCRISSWAEVGKYSCAPFLRDETFPSPQEL